MEQTVNRPTQPADRFDLGVVLATRSVCEDLTAGDIRTAIERHARGDWGLVCPEDRQANEDALRNGDRLLSVYQSGQGQRFWIITEADRSATTVLLPDEY